MSVELLDVIALSPLQRGLYTVSTTTRGIDPYLVTFSVRVENLTDPAGLRRAFDQLLQRYPQLGAHVVSDGLPHPVLVITSAGRIDWRETDLRQTDDPVAAARNAYAGEGRRRLDLDKGPLFRVTLARVAELDYELICTAHHLVLDGWSIPIMFADLIALHQGKTLPAPPPLRDHAAWLAAKDTDESRRVWGAALAGLEPMPMLVPPADPDLPVVGEARFGTAETAQVTAWARARGLTMNTLLQLSWARILSGLVGRDEVVFGQTTSGRDATLPGAEQLVGALVATIPVRVVVDERAPADAAAQLQREMARLRAHEYLGMAEITRQAGTGQLFDTLFVFENVPVGGMSGAMPMGGGARLIARRIDSPSHYPLTMVPIVEDGELVSRVELRRDLVDRFDPDRLARRMLAVLRGLIRADHLCDVDILLDDEAPVLESDVAVQRVSGAVPGELVAGHPSGTVPDVLLAAAERTPSAVAVVDTVGEQSFGEFAAAVRALAQNLRALGLGAGAAVAVALPRDRRVLHAPFAIGHAGAVCVHVDPATPVDRLAYLLETSGARVVLADPELTPALDAVRAAGVEVRQAIPDASGGLRVVGAALADVTGPADVAGRASAAGPFYVVFTSGTTGRPKGVVVPHGALLNHWANHRRRIFEPVAARLGRPLRVGHGWSTGFDAAWQPTIALLSGHTVVLLDEATRTDAERIVAAIDRDRIDMFDTSPSMLQRLIAAGLLRERAGAAEDGADGAGEYCPLAVLALGGEAISPDTWNRLRGLASTSVLNFYGPTETTVEAFMAEVDAQPAPTIGRPFDGMTAEVLDHRLRPVPPGGRGELYLSGAQLALGYLGRAAATAASFVAGPGGRRYRTGDLVRRTPASTVVYEGRIDNQVKINGYRVEPDETAAVLRELAGVRQAAALAFVENGRTRLGALVVGAVSIGDIRTELAHRLPQFLIPARIVLVDEIPLNRNDKLDAHRATELLARPVGEVVAPASDTERMLLELIAAMGDSHRQQRIGMSDSLVEIGLDSIGVIDLVSRLRGAGHRIAARDVLAAADLRELAARLDRLGPHRDETDAVPAGAIIPLTELAQEVIAHGDFRYLAQSQVITLPPDATPELVADRLAALAKAHPALRSRLGAVDGTPVLIVGEASPPAVTAVTGVNPARRRELLAETVLRLAPEDGRMVAATLLDGTAADGTPERLLLLSIHHLAVDVVSWLILADDLRLMADGLPPINETRSETAPQPCTTAPPVLGVPLRGRLTEPARDRMAAVLTRVVELGAESTGRLLRLCAETGVPLEDLLLVASAALIAETADQDGRVSVTRESHGRAADDDSRQVGWFTVEETVTVALAELTGWTPAAGRPPLADRTTAARGQLRLNHLGRFDVLEFGSGPWTPVPMADFAEEFGAAAHPELPLRFTIDISTAVVVRADGPSLVARLDINSAVLDAAGADACAEGWSARIADFLDPVTAVAQ
ncbi:MULTISPECIES: AMP-binding protein [unclassified Nocardia]|uniref:non-ribosomal peptide synthetase n=1 Tax=unclassified Nocardia TaxID=2637762 RepID=UPI001CE3E3A6|nr:MULTISPECIES: AMP-binding protein [unclassified Nocardia]